MKLLRTTDFEEAVVRNAITRRYHEIRHEEMEQQAEMITHKITEAWNRGQK